MRWLFLLGSLGSLGSLGAGCFYADRINQRPSADIRVDSSDPARRGGTVSLSAEVFDPEGDALFVSWRVQACADATDLATCDPTPFFTSLLPAVAFAIPALRADGTPTRSIRVVLDARDAVGATARPEQELVIPVLDRTPDLAVSSASRYGFAVGTPVDLAARWTDADDAAAAVTVTWKVYAPAGSAEPALADVALGPDRDPAFAQAGRRLVPDVPGRWEVEVTATDPLGEARVVHEIVTVLPDRPPCLSTSTPLVPPAGAALPLLEATRFQVLLVSDDLDPYPGRSDDPYTGVARFAWSLRGPGDAARRVLPGATGNSVTLDPAVYAPGDVLEVRVEIADRAHDALPCADGAATCAVGADACLQRQTWQVVVP